MQGYPMKSANILNDDAKLTVSFVRVNSLLKLLV
jgi:hypothetical protein